MPSTLTYPGIYIEELSSGVRTITGASTSTTAFVDFCTRGDMNRPIQLTSFMDFERELGGLDTRSEGGYAVQQFYLNGGQRAWFVRVAGGTPLPAMIELRDQQASSPQRALLLEASSPGVWGMNVQVAVGHIPDDAERFNLVVRELSSTGTPRQVLSSQIHRGLSLKTDDPRFVTSILASESKLIRVSSRNTAIGLGNIPASTAALVKPSDPTSTDREDVTNPAVIGNASSASFYALGSDPDDPTQQPNDGSLPDADALIKGMMTLDTIAPEIFNILCLPRAADLPENDMKDVYTEAIKYCEDKRAFVILDIPRDTNTLDKMKTWKNGVGAGLRSNNAAVYYPRLEIPDRKNERRPRNVGVSGTLAGVYARTDATRGVWKTPAGTDADLRGATTIIDKLTDLENGILNLQGVNASRSFPIFGNVSWGGRTMNGAEQQGSEWKYIAVRRTALFIEESLYQGLKWVVFEPNDEPLWASIRLNVGAFMQDLFRKGAFQGATPAEAYLVKCDKETTTQNDINAGIVNILVGFAPLKPAEFVVLKIQQLAGQIEV
jgi:phage tail sheath protein FI